MRLLLVPAVLALAAAPAAAADIRGQYVEARTCDVFTGACFANADTGLTGKNAVLGWKIESGAVGQTKLDGLSVVAVVAARDTLGLAQTAPGKAVVIVDESATPEQRAALVKFVKRQAGDLAADVVDVRSAKVELNVCNCAGEGCATLRAGSARVTTRCLDAEHDKACGNECAYYPPLTNGVTAKAAMAVEHTFAGKGLNETWSDTDRRGAYVGSFVAR
ncbi:MAG TPA: DUF1326 domain-containing protein [Gemmataceae bacterium]|jgi:hypothetical protein